MTRDFSFNDWLSTGATGVLESVAQFPSEVLVILATGLVTVVTTIITQIFLARADSRKARREDARDARKRREGHVAALNEIKAAKLAEVWDALELARVRLADCECEASTRDSPPPATDWACAATSHIFGLSLRYFPDMRRLAYELHVATTTYEGNVWCGKYENLNEMEYRITDARTKVADAIEEIAKDLQNV